MRLVAGQRRGIATQAASLRDLLFHCNDDLALCAPGLDVGQRISGLLKREDLIHDRTDHAGFDQGRDFAQLLSLRTHEQE